ncbi:MAG: hypothetical protein ACI8RZ_000944 [Myxococcota bacterium]|jgi:hypothetical protein
MLRWTPAGAVSLPQTVQIRVQQRYPGRVEAGAPLPTRSLSPVELADNIRYFTIGLRTPRTAPCTALVLSGVGVAQRSDTPAAMALARSEGIQRIILHAGTEDLTALPLADFAQTVTLLVVPIQGEPTAALAAISAAHDAGLMVCANVVLTLATLPHLPSIAAALAVLGPQQTNLTYPLPTSERLRPVPAQAQAISAVTTAATVLESAGRAVNIKGLPVCYLGELARLVRRTHNRWYVDADHQQDRALLFFPGVVSFHKEDTCRFCTADAHCDGFFTEYLSRDGFPALAPITPY